jgi:phosphopantothenate synthetase
MMTEVIQTTDLKIGIDGVAKPVNHVISDVKTLESEKAALIEKISQNDTERGNLERQLRHVESRMKHLQDHLDIQFPHYTPSPNE